MIRVLATSKSGSEHIVTGGVKDKVSYLWKTKEEAKQHLERIEWTNIRFAIDIEETSQEKLTITWDNQSKTEHVPGSGSFIYLRGGPQS